MKQKKKNKVKGTRMLFWGCIFLVFAVVFVKQQFMINRLNAQKEVSKHKLVQLKDSQAFLNEQVKYTKQVKYIEDQAREKLGLVKPGEILFIDKSKQK